MAANRKLLSEIQQVLKKIEEGVEIFDETIAKVYAAETQTLKEKFESDLKKEIKKLQRLRDQVKTWLSSNEVKDKNQLSEAKRLIETKMELFKVCEKDTKTKAYSKEGLAREAKLDPKEAAREEKRQWLNDCLEQLNDLINTIEAEKEKASNAKGNKNKNKENMEKFDNRIQKQKFHVGKIELILRLLDSEELDPSELDNIKDSLEYYLETAADDDGALGVEHEFDIYEDLGLEQYTANHEFSPRGHSADAHGEDEKVPAPMSLPEKEPEKPVEKEKEKEKEKHAEPSHPPAPAATNAKAAVPPVAAKTITKGVTVASVVAANLEKSPAAVTSPPGAPAPKAAAAHGEKSDKPQPTIAQVVSGNLNPPSEAKASPAAPAQQPAKTAASVVASPPPNVPHPPPGVTVPPAQPAPVPAPVAAPILTTPPQPVAPAPPILQPPAAPPAPVVTVPVTPPVGLTQPQAFAGQMPSLTDEMDKLSLSRNQLPPQPGLQAVGAQPGLVVGPGVAPQKMTSPQQPALQAPAMQAALKGSPTKVPQNVVGFPPTGIPGVPEVGGLNKPIGEISPAMSGLGGLIGTPVSSGLATTPNLPAGFTPEMLNTLAILKQASQFMPEPEQDRPPQYVPRNFYNTHPAFPSTPLFSNNETTQLFDKLSWDTYFFAFYFQQGSYQQYLAAKKLKKGSWRFHKKYTTWFQRHNEPKVATKDYEEGTYLYFDFESGWCNRIKTEFKFEYAFLEDEVNINN